MIELSEAGTGIKVLAYVTTDEHETIKKLVALHPAAASHRLRGRDVAFNWIITKKEARELFPDREIIEIEDEGEPK